MQPQRDRSESHLQKGRDKHERSPFDNRSLLQLLRVLLVRSKQSGWRKCTASCRAGNRLKLTLLSKSRLRHGLQIFEMLVVRDAVAALALQQVGVVGGWLDGRRFQMGRDWSLSMVAGVEIPDLAAV